MSSHVRRQFAGFQHLNGIIDHITPLITYIPIIIHANITITRFKVNKTLIFWNVEMCFWAHRDELE